MSNLSFLVLSPCSRRCCQEGPRQESPQEGRQGQEGRSQEGRQEGSRQEGRQEGWQEEVIGPYPSLLIVVE